MEKRKFCSLVFWVLVVSSLIFNGCAALSRTTGGVSDARSIVYDTKDIVETIGLRKKSKKDNTSPSAKESIGEPTKTAGIDSLKSGEIKLGEKIIFQDPLSKDKIGERPAKWELLNGGAVIAELEGKKFIRTLGNSAKLHPRGITSLPDRYSIQYKVYIYRHRRAWGTIIHTLSWGEDGPEFSFDIYHGEVFFTHRITDIRKEEKVEYNFIPLDDKVSASHWVTLIIEGNRFRLYLNERLILDSEATRSKDEYLTFSFEKETSDELMFKDILISEYTK